MGRSRTLAALAALTVLTVPAVLAGCSTGSDQPDPTSSASSHRPTRPSELRDAHVVFLAADLALPHSQQRQALYVSTVDGRDRHLLLPAGIVSTFVTGSRDGSVILFDAWPEGVDAGESVWWADTSGIHPLPDDGQRWRAIALAPDGTSAVEVVGRFEDLAWSVRRVDLRSGAVSSVCEGCVVFQQRTDSPAADVAVSGDGAYVGTLATFVGGFYGIQTRGDVRLTATDGGQVRWSTTALGGTPIDVDDDGSLVWSGAWGRQGSMLHEAELVPAPAHDRATGIEAVFAGPLSDGWWYATLDSRTQDAPLVIHETPRLVPSASHVVATWPHRWQVGAMALAEVTAVDWPAPVASSS